MVIRKLKESDIDLDFLNLVCQFRETNLTVWQARLIFRKYKPVIYGIFDKTLIGIATLIIEHKFIRNGGVVGHIEDVIVDNRNRKLGVGSDLVKYLIEESRKAGAYKVILNCESSLERWYSKLGFENTDLGMRIDL